MAEVFPSTLIPNYPCIVEQEWKTIISDFDSGHEQRRQKHLFPKFNAELQFNALNSGQIQSLWDFYAARKGSYEAFYLYDPHYLAAFPSSYTSLYVGTGDGVTETFDLPGRSLSTQTIYIDGGETTYDSISSTTGDGNSDQVVFSAAPSNGVTISASFAGQLRIRCRFASDKLSRNMFEKLLFTDGIELKGLLST